MLQVMRLARVSTTDEARLPRNKPKMLLVAYASGMISRQCSGAGTGIGPALWLLLRDRLFLLLDEALKAFGEQ